MSPGRSPFDITAAVAAFSRSVLGAVQNLIRQATEGIRRLASWVGGLVRRFARRVWTLYYRVEGSIALLVVESILTLYALRYLVLIAAPAIGLFLAGHWAWSGVYVLLIIVAFVFFRSQQLDASDAIRQQRKWLEPIVRWALRVGVSVAAFIYFSGPARLASVFEAQTSVVQGIEPPPNVAVKRPKQQQKPATVPTPSTPVPQVNPNAARIEAPKGIKPEPPPQNISMSGATGSVPGGQLAGVVGGIAPPPPAMPMRVEGDIEEPKKIKDVKPVYPPIAQTAKIQGIVLIEAIIGKDGRVKEAKVLRPAPMLDQAALEAVRQWVYAPTLVNGQPVEIVMTVSVPFTLQ